MVEFNAPKDEGVEDLLAFLPVLYADGFEPVESWSGGETNEDGVLVMPWPRYHPSVLRFFAIAAGDFWSDTSYMSNRVSAAAKDAEVASLANLEDLKAMLTWCVRGERFCDGHWEDVIKDGSVRNILLRLSELYRQ